MGGKSSIGAGLKLQRPLTLSKAQFSHSASTVSQMRFIYLPTMMLYIAKVVSVLRPGVLSAGCYHRFHVSVMWPAVLAAGCTVISVIMKIMVTITSL